MGGGAYDVDVAQEARSSNANVFSYRGYATSAEQATQHRAVHQELNPYGKIRECRNPTPIVVAMDVTRSRGNDSKIIYSKLPLFIGQIIMKNYVPGPALSFAAIGDASAGDAAPLQVGQFEADNRLDAVLSKIWLEEGGGGSGQESYELAAYFYARHSKLACVEEGRRGFFFFLGDEGFYPQVKKEQIQRILGREVDASVDSAQIFAELQRLYHVFLIFPQKTMAERKQDIDAEIKKRVEAAGGLYEGVDIRASLIWDNRNDLDLHLLTPSGEHLYYGNKKSTCGGWLDVDQNVRGETTKPVENVRWRKGSAPAGHYRVYVQNYRFHESDLAPTRFRVEIEVNGEVRQFESVVSPKQELREPSNVPIYEFDFDPSARPTPSSERSEYAKYADDVILAQWASVIPPEHILKIQDPKAIVDVMLGALALVGGGRDLNTYLSDMREREQLDLRQDQAVQTLGDLASSLSMSQSSVSGAVPVASRASRQPSRTSRL
jgi:hypothetical protein